MTKDALVEADARDLFRLARRLERVDKPVAAAIKKTLTTETKKVVTAVRQEVLSIPAKDGQTTKMFHPQRYRRLKGQTVLGPLVEQQPMNVRQGIAKGVRSAIRYGNSRRGASIAVIGSSHFLPENKKAMNKVLNFPSWRHPVYGNRNVWVEQKGHPFFGRVTSKFRKPIHDALVKAVEQSIEAEIQKHGTWTGF